MVAQSIVLADRPQQGRLGSFSLKPAPPAQPKPKPAEAVRVKSEQSLLYKILLGQVPKPDAAAIGYLDDTLLEQDTSLTPELVKQCYMEGMPLVANILKTKWGNIATVIIPRFQYEIFTDQDGLHSDLMDAFELCKTMGVSNVALTGLIPSATNYGRDLLKTHSQREDLPKPTTGHATTTACMVLTVSRILKEAGRRISDEKVAFLGLGSVGLATLRLMLTVLKHPKEITLCDVHQKKSFLDEVADECVAMGFKGKLNVCPTRGEAPDAVYNHTLIIGATNVPDILNIDRLNAGTCVVDDSAPHCFNPEKAIKRCTEKADILVTEGGPMKLTHPIHDTFFFPKRWESFDHTEGTPVGAADRQQRGNTKVDVVFEVGMKRDPCEVMGCTFSALLSSVYPELLPTVGTVDVDTCAEHYKVLIDNGFQGCDLSCDDYFFDTQVAERFRKKTCSSITGRMYICRSNSY
eukprot:NODE_129_length_1443_cov_20.916786_g99_i0.p1 GENE.NODE_129_length_1443_cov_20.916786_g99_i0~~NODE_129_length_1443_cov_20.916786_g99_i0.p1  ORF type:complete len:480 (-),score=126.24 NODE_129_length_1443_cov_20.916786_g99_i0:3-1394(-)